MLRLFLAAFALFATAATANPYRDDALTVSETINARYAYLERLEGAQYRLTSKLQREAEAVSSESKLLAFAERALLLLADHHAITGSSFDDSWAVVPAYSDLWVERNDDHYIITAVRSGSPAEEQGIVRGDRLVAVDGKDMADAVRKFWLDLGVEGKIGVERASFAARILAAGQRDRSRILTVRRGKGERLELTLATLYARQQDLPPVASVTEGNALRIRFNDSLGSDATIDAFDRAMATAAKGQSIILDLTDTPSGGNTVIARAIMGWFVDKPRPYQMHRSPEEERRTGIARSWVEYVSPRKGKYHKGKVTVRVGRWTGSMGEGLALGFSALGARVEGERMAGLFGAIEDIKLPNSGLIVKIPVESLYSVDGKPREVFEPRRMPKAKTGKD
jgi:C-terminal processing protease CtpA/Prc